MRRADRFRRRVIRPLVVMALVVLLTLGIAGGLSGAGPLGFVGVALGTATVTLDKDSPSISASVRAQLDYVLAHWQSSSNDEFGYQVDADCANFASQSLLKRGFSPDDTWNYTPHAGDWTFAWQSSTSLRRYLLGKPDRVREFEDSERDRVKLGDLVQFDWDRSGDRDHTGIVTRIVIHPGGQREIFYAGHTDHTDYRSVDVAITQNHPGASVYYLSISG